MRKLGAVFFAIFFSGAAWANVRPVNPPKTLRPEVVPGRLLREVVQKHWTQAALQAALLTADHEALQGVNRIPAMQTAWWDSTGIRTLGGWNPCLTEFAVVLPEDMAFVPPAVAKALLESPVRYFPENNLIVVAGDIEPDDIQSGMGMVLVAMQANLPREPAIWTGRRLTEWFTETVARLQKALDEN